MRSVAGPWWRLDGEPPDQWSWRPFDSPRFRFDSAEGVVRVRYASSSAVGAARERYRDTGSYVPADHAGHLVVRCDGRVRVLDLRSERVLDLLGLDDRISTGREPAVWAAAQALTDRVVAWWGERCHGVAYRSRTTPESAANLAFFEWAPFEYSAVELADARELRDELVVAYGFTVGF